MSASKKENLFAKLAQQTARAEAAPSAETLPPEERPAESADDAPPPLPASEPAAPIEQAKPRPAAARKKPEPVSGKRTNPEYCQANAYVPKALRKEVDRALLDIEGLDYSSLVEDLLRKWLKSKGIVV